jgi:hypothetical protein
VNVATWALFLVSGTAAPGGAGPTGPPTNGFATNYGTELSPLVRLDWTNGDASAYTRIYNTTVSFDNLLAIRNPGITLWQSGSNYSLGQVFKLTHFKNGQESAALTVVWNG